MADVNYTFTLSSATTTTWTTGEAMTVETKEVPTRRNRAATACQAQNPDNEVGGFCTRRKGHEGPHQRRSVWYDPDDPEDLYNTRHHEEEVTAEWPNEQEETTPEHNEPLLSSEACKVPHPDGITFPDDDGEVQFCTRRKGHTGSHCCTASFWEPTDRIHHSDAPGAMHSSWANNSEEEEEVEETMAVTEEASTAPKKKAKSNEERFCMKQDPETGWTCVLTKGHLCSEHVALQNFWNSDERPQMGERPYSTKQVQEWYPDDSLLAVWRNE